MEENMIRVTGSGTIHVEPDVTRIELSLVSIHDSYEDAYKQAQNDTDKLKKIMEELKLDVTLPKTKSLDINKKTKSDYDRNNHYIGEIFLGFELSHNVKIDWKEAQASRNQYRLYGERPTSHTIEDAGTCCKGCQGKGWHHGQGMRMQAWCSLPHRLFCQ